MYDCISSELVRTLKKIIAPPPEKLCRRTCPECGKRLVNIYRRGEEWKCRQCWEVKDNE